MPDSSADLTTNEKDPIRVLLVMHGAGSGGVETALSTLCKYLDRGRVHMTVAVPKEGPFTEKIRALGIEVIQTPMEWWTPASFEFGEKHYYRFLSGLKDRVDALVRIIREHRIDVVHSATLTVIDGAIAAKVSGTPHIWNLRGKFNIAGPSCDSTFGNYFSLELTYSIVNEVSSRVVANSEGVADFLATYLPPQKMEVIRNGVDLEKFEEQGASFTAGKFPSLDGQIKIAFMGGISRIKGTTDFVDAAALVLKERKDCAFLLIGDCRDKALEPVVLEKIGKTSMPEKFVVTGRRDDIPAILGGIDLLVCSSLSEGLPNSVMEAMAASRAVVATRCGGTTELVVHDDTGYLVEVGNPEELAKAILRAIEDRSRLEHMGKRGRQRIEELFSAGACARKFEELYRRVISEQHPVKTVTPWGDLALLFMGDLGRTGTRVLAQEREIRDLRGFVHLLKDNLPYKMLKKSGEMLRKYLR